MIITWRYLSLKHQRYFDSPTELEEHLATNPDDQVIEVSVDVTHSGVVSEVPDKTDQYFREPGGTVRSASISGGKLYVVTSGTEYVEYTETSELIAVSGNLQDQLDEKLPVSGGNVTGSINIADPDEDFTTSGTPICAFVQANLTTGVDLDSTRNELALETATALQYGSGVFQVQSGYITIKKPGIYKVTWSVCAENEGGGGSPRKTLLVDLNRNHGSYISASLGGSYTRDANRSNYVQCFGSYYIETTSANETVALRSRRVGSSNGTFPLRAGYLCVEFKRY